MIASLAIALFLVCGEPTHVYVENKEKEVWLQVEPITTKKFLDIEILQYRILGPTEDVRFHNQALLELTNSGQKVIMYNSSPCTKA